jgi:hypothetical protein
MKKFTSVSSGSLYAHPLPGAPLSIKPGRQSTEGMPKVVDCRQTGVQAMNKMVMQNNTRVYPCSGRRVGVIPYVMFCFVIAVSNNVLQTRLP